MPYPGVERHEEGSVIRQALDFEEHGLASGDIGLDILLAE
jgi:hypothetical protein